jgi:TadE-like protein
MHGAAEAGLSSVIGKNKMIRFRRRFRNSSRRGATAVEFAIVGPIAFFLLLSVMVGALGVFRYHEVAHVAREAARWASVRGEGYAKVTGKPKVGAGEVTEYVKSHVHLIDGAAIAVQFTAIDTIVVEVKYNWTPEIPGLANLTGPILLKSRAEIPMAF